MGSWGGEEGMVGSWGGQRVHGMVGGGRGTTPLLVAQTSRQTASGEAQTFNDSQTLSSIQALYGRVAGPGHNLTPANSPSASTCIGACIHSLANGLGSISFHVSILVDDFNTMIFHVALL